MYGKVTNGKLLCSALKSDVTIFRASLIFWSRIKIISSED